MQLTDSNLLKQHCYINGLWKPASSSAQRSVHNPDNGELIGKVPMLSTEECAEAIDAAHVAWQTWRALTGHKRASYLRKWHELILQHAHDLALILTSEQGKPLQEALGEIRYAATFVDWFADEARRINGDVLGSPNSALRLMTLRQPVGVCAAITPWNFPAAMLTRKIAPALAAGCTMVLKPAEQTPLSALALAELAHHAGIPPGVLNIITGDAPTLGTELCRNPLVRKLSFTGSTEVGKLLMRQCADTVKKLSLELGGNAPFIIFDDADLSAAIEGAISAKFRNSGQTCVCANRIYVQQGIYDQFCTGFANALQKLQPGPGIDPQSTQGPLIDVDALNKVERLVDDAQRKGAKVICGGKRHARGGTYYEPTLITHANHDMQCMHEEIFGPVAPVMAFTTEAEVIALANDSQTGLAAYVYTENMARLMRVSEALEYGMVGCNTGLISNEVAPFGGIKQSGLGREGSRYGIEEYLELKYLCLAVPPARN